MPSTDGLRASITTILAEELEIEPEELAADEDFFEAYGADSLTVLAVLARLERELGIVIPPEQAAAMTTADDVVALADRHRTQATPHA
ncbi:MAG TPA: acyl carrier protein [Micromonosporaceae bacterium]